MVKKIICAALICAAVCAGIFFIQNPTVYNKDYWQDLGISGSHLYEDIVKDKGEPSEIIADSDSVTVVYDDVQFVWNYPDAKGIFDRAEVTSDTVKFGKLTLGSSREDVERAYKSRYIQEIKDLESNRLGYIDGDAWVTYTFDEDDTVEQISVTTGV